MTYLVQSSLASSFYYLNNHTRGLVERTGLFFHKVCYTKCNILSRVCGDYNRRGIGLTTGFIGSKTITVYTLYDSQQLSFFSSSEDYGSNSATTAATSSYGVPCHYSLTDSLTNCPSWI
jgi:hypothetical protein